MGHIAQYEQNFDKKQSIIICICKNMYVIKYLKFMWLSWININFFLECLVFIACCSYWWALHSLRVSIWNENCGEEAYTFPHVQNCHKMTWGGKSHYKPVLSFGQIALILSPPPPAVFASLINQENALLQIHSSEVYSSLLLSMPKPLDLQGKGWHLGRFPRFTLFQQTVWNIPAFYWNLSRLSLF